MKVNDILEAKGRKVFTIKSDKSLKEALDLIVINKIGALLVLNEKDDFVGIISERDLVREFHKADKVALDKTISEIMTTNIIVGILEDEIEEVEAIMTENRFRHLPIMNEGKVVGIVSIGDIVKSLSAKRKTENRYLKEYIMGKYPA